MSVNEANQMQTSTKASMWIENLEFDWSPFFCQSKEMHLARHQSLFDQEETIKHIYVVLEGRIRLSITNKLGEEKAIMIVGKNGIIGDLGLYATNAYLTSAITASSCRLLAFTVEDFKRLLTHHQDVLPFYLLNVGLK